MKTNVGIIGCGNISAAYIKTIQKMDALALVACADRDHDRAVARASEYHIPRTLSVSELLADPEIEIVLNLTTPEAHAEVALAALQAGKSVYNEKPLAATREPAREMLRLAAERDLRIGCAPDTFLGGGLQTCRKLIDDGWIGTVVSAEARFASRGPEGWHPDPTFVYKPGGGPLFDMGPYYLTALAALLGPVRQVSGSARITFPERTIGSGPKKGQKIAVEVPTYVAAVLDFAGGPVATLTASFDIPTGYESTLEVHGSTGSLRFPDPNGYGGDIHLRPYGDAEWTRIPLLFGYRENDRGVGVADMASAIRAGRPHRASAELAYHVLDIMQSIHDASTQGRSLPIESTLSRPAPLPLGLLPGQID